MTYRELYCWGKESLLMAGVEEAELDARLLLEYVCGTNRNDLLVHGDRIVQAGSHARYVEMVGKRMSRVPLQYLTGTQEFMGLEFLVNEHVLIPRQDTEILVEEVLKNLHDGMRVLDMCTGSGCILISILRYSNNCQGVGTDISGKALGVAGRNAARLLDAGKKECESIPFSDAEEICFLQGDLFEKVSGKFDIIVSNPPYIPSHVTEALMPEVKDYEPKEALDGGEDGLVFYRRIVEEAAGYLFGGGMLFFEIGYDQAEAVRTLMEQAGFLEVQIVQDYAGLDRVVYGTLGFGSTGL